MAHRHEAIADMLEGVNDPGWRRLTRLATSASADLWVMLPNRKTQTGLQVWVRPSKTQFSFQLTSGADGTWTVIKERRCAFMKGTEVLIDFMDALVASQAEPTSRRRSSGSTNWPEVTASVRSQAGDLCARAELLASVDPKWTRQFEVYDRGSEILIAQPRAPVFNGWEIWVDTPPDRYNMKLRHDGAIVRELDVVPEETSAALHELLGDMLTDRRGA